MRKRTLKRLLRRVPFLKDEFGGSPAIELAFALPVIGLLFGGIFDIGLVMWRSTTVAHISHEGARYASVRGNVAEPVSMEIDPLVATDITDFQTYVKDLAIGIDPADLTVAISWNPADNNAKGNQVIVNVSYSYTPFLDNFFPIGPIAVDKTSTMTIMQ
jgi:Flp pilus assembly protein TadG